MPTLAPSGPVSPTPSHSTALSPSATVSVTTSPTATLPVTGGGGSHPEVIAGVGLLIVIAGWALVRATRRRRALT